MEFSIKILPLVYGIHSAKKFIQLLTTFSCTTWFLGYEIPYWVVEGADPSSRHASFAQ